VPLDPSFPPFLATLEQGGWTPLMDGRPAPEARARYRQLSLLRRGEGYTPEPVADVEDRSVDGPGGAVPVRIYTPGTARGPVVVWLHGGGWVLGDLDTVDPICRRVANAVDAVVVSVDYRLAPEHPHPAGLDDTMTVLRWAAAQWPDAPLVVGGDSAGGGLAAGAALRARDEGGPRLVAQLLVYPALDPSQGQPSVKENGEGLFLSAADMRAFYDAYVPGGLATDPRVAVLSAPDLSGLPPAVVATAEFDPLRDEGDAYARRLADAGVPVRHLPGLGLVHGYFGLAEIAPAAGARREEVLTALSDLTSTDRG
jgi:acetyl esterase/lipase